jgi:hypothetical protein
LLSDYSARRRGKRSRNGRLGKSGPEEPGSSCVLGPPFRLSVAPMDAENGLVARLVCEKDAGTSGAFAGLAFLRNRREHFRLFALGKSVPFHFARSKI